MNNDKADPPSIALLPSSLRPTFDPGSDKVLEAIRSECLEALQKPFDVASLRLVTEMLGHANAILQLRRGAPGPRRKRGFPVNMVDYGEDGVSGEAVLAGAPMTETAGTHAMREIVGLMGRLTESFSAMTSSKKGGAHDDALATESLVRALVSSQDLPDDVRPRVQEGIREKLAGVMGEPPPRTTIEAAPFENGPRAAPEAAQ